MRLSPVRYELLKAALDGRTSYNQGSRLYTVWNLPEGAAFRQAIRHVHEHLWRPLAAARLIDERGGGTVSQAGREAVEAHEAKRPGRARNANEPHAP